MNRLNSRLFRSLLVVFCSFCLGSVALPQSSHVKAYQISDTFSAINDWPQLAHDAQRSNATDQAITGPYRFYWRWTSVPFAGRVQPVVADNRLFIGGLNGSFYALDATYDSAGGEPRIIWQRDLGSPIRAGAGVDGDVVVVGTHHGMIYGFDVANGETRWSFAVGGAVLAAPLIANGVAYLGAADGWFYALRINDGSLLWKTTIGVPILGSAALSSDGNRIFFVAEDVKAYALSANNGHMLWQTQLQGQSGADRWPVVIGGTVVFRTMPIGFFHDLLHDGDDAMDAAGPRQSDWNADWAAVRSSIMQYLSGKPDEQTFFALDAVTGQSRGVAPVLYTFGNNDPPAPPASYNGALYLPYRARHGIQNDSTTAVHVTSRYDAELGLMDPTSLDITGLRSPIPFVYQFRLTSDESAVLTIGGTSLFVDSWERLGSIDRVSGQLSGIAQVAYDFPECYVQCGSNNSLMPFYSNYPFPGPRSGEGYPRTGVLVASHRIFWRVLESGLASIGPGTATVQQPPSDGHQSEPFVRPTTTIHPSTRHFSDQELRSYIWNTPTAAIDIPDDLRGRLDEEIGRIVASNEHMLPFYIERGFNGSGSWPPTTSNPPEPAAVQNSKAYWFDPGELILSLSMVYPYLSSERQTQLRSYFQAEMTRYPPLEALSYGSQTWLKQGRPRESYARDLPSRNGWNTWPPPDVPVQTIYALWRYAQVTGDWKYVSDHWGEIQALFAARKQSIDSYAEIAGPIGYARIAQQLDDNEAASDGEAVALAAMRDGMDFAGWRERANQLYPDPRDLRVGQRGQVFFGLTPEVGQYLRDTNLQAVQNTLEETISYPNGSYLWYMTRLGIQAEKGESSYHTPELGWSIFLVQAYVLKANQNQLRYWLDRPWGLGDVWYLQKLAILITSPIPSIQTPTPTQPPPKRECVMDGACAIYIPFLIHKAT